MSDGNKFAAVTFAQQHRLPLEEMSNILLDAMQGTLICLDNHHIIIDVCQTIKCHFGFEQAELIGISILLLVEDSERDFFLKFLNCSQKGNDVCFVRMMLNHINEYRQVKIYQKKKMSVDTTNVHSTTTRSGCSIATTLIITLEETSFIDITLHDINKQEFYTKMNLFGEITLVDHRVAFITGFLPHELCSQSIFKFIYQDDRLVKLHALWKCVTAGVSKLQWRFNARDGSLIFLQTEYKLIVDLSTNQQMIFARNEVLSQVQRSQFDELQIAWKHQCAADIKGNNSSFKIISSSDSNVSLSVSGECRICVPTLNICFTTNKLHPLNVIGNIFEDTKLTRPLTIQDYIHILIENHKYIDQELKLIITNIQSLTARYRQFNEMDNSQTDSLEKSIDEKTQTNVFSSSIDTASNRKQESDSIVRGILRNSMQPNQQKSSDDSLSTLTRLLNENGDSHPTQNTVSLPTSFNSPSISQPIEFSAQPAKHNPHTFTPENQQHLDFVKKYTAAKNKFESQLEILRQQEILHGSQAVDVAKRTSLLNKLAQLETIKNRHLARQQEWRRQLTTPMTPVRQNELNEFYRTPFASSLSTTYSSGFSSMDTNGKGPSISSPMPSLLCATNDRSSPSNYKQQVTTQRSSSQSFDTNLTSNDFDSFPQTQTSLLDEFLTPPPSSSSFSLTYPSTNNLSSLSVHSYMNVSFHGASNESLSPSPFHVNHQYQYPPTHPY